MSERETLSEAAESKVETSTPPPLAELVGLMPPQARACDSNTADQHLPVLSFDMSSDSKAASSGTYPRCIQTSAGAAVTSARQGAQQHKVEGGMIADKQGRPMEKARIDDGNGNRSRLELPKPTLSSEPVRRAWQEIMGNMPRPRQSSEQIHRVGPKSR